MLQGKAVAASQTLLDRAEPINGKVRHLAMCDHAAATRTLVWEGMEHVPAMPLLLWLLLAHMATDNYSDSKTNMCRGQGCASDCRICQGRRSKENSADFRSSRG